LNGRQGLSQNHWGHFGEEKNLLLCQELNPGFVHYYLALSGWSVPVSEQDILSSSLGLDFYPEDGGRMFFENVCLKVYC
jgi:hypothetical protein